MTASEEEICGEFQAFGVVVRNPDVIDKMREICIVYKVAPVDLAEHWFAFSTSNDLGSEPTVKLLTKLENEQFVGKKRIKTKSKSALEYVWRSAGNFPDELSTPSIDESDESVLLEAYGTPDVCAAKKKRQKTPDSATSKRFGSDVGGLNSRRSIISADVEANSPLSQSPISVASSTPSAKYASRTNSGDVSCVFGEMQLSDVEWRQPSMPVQSVTIKPYGDETVLTERYKYMYIKLELISTILDDRIDEIAAAIRGTNDVSQDVCSVVQQTAEEVTVFGRVSCDGNGRLNPSSIILEGSLETSNGHHVHLDVSNLTAYSLFPGQIVALSGVNSTGHRLLCHKLLSNGIPSFPDTSRSFTGDFLNFVVAAGPYMTSDSMSYDPLCDLLKAVDEQKPHVCILIGPFVDAKQKQIEEATFRETYESIFAQCMKLILSYSRGSSTQFVIVPSSRDVHHDYVYPTPPFSCSKAYSQETNIHFMSDPSVLDVASVVVVGVTSADVLMHLGREEISFPSMTDRLGRLASHLLLQRSFYPLYPPSEDMNIDYEKLETVGRLSVTPHVLLLPSDLNAFIKDVQGCCCINPQRLTRATGGGTYARFRIRSATSKSSSSIVSRVACQIVRI